ncbi:laminin subunit alpha-1-like [Glandiceps talaboti]
MHHIKELICCILIAAMVTVAQDTGECIDKACYPPFEDLIVAQYVNRTVSTSSTCGTPPNTYELIDTNADDEDSVITMVCNASNPDEEHPVEFLHDRETDIQLGEQVEIPNINTWWQSANQVSDVKLTLSLIDEFLFQEMTLAFRSPRPVDMYFESSINGGLSWQRLKYYAQDCVSSFPSVPTGPETGTTATCEEAYFQGDENTFVPGPIQEVLYNPVKLLGKSYFDFSTQQFFLATDIRVTLLTPPSASDPVRSFFAVVDWDVRGQCACFGHADECTGENGADCICQHNTMGKNCEQCLPLYNNKLWAAGVGIEANACEDCGCNGHATTCHYDASKQYGVCDNCQDNTMGDKCETCLSSFYKNPFSLPGVNDTCDDSEVSFPCNESCITCNCSSTGTVPNTFCDQTSGQCVCKPNVGGRACDTCMDTFWNLEAGCQACSCYEAGSKDTSNFCDKITGQCICKANTKGAECKECKSGSYNLQPSNPDGCTLCGCDIGGALDSICNPDASGQCNCRPNHITGRACNDADPGFYVPRLDGIIKEAEFATSNQIVEHSNMLEGGGLNTGIGYLSVAAGAEVTFTNIQIPRSQLYEAVLRYETSSLWAGSTLELSLQNAEPYECNGQTLSGGLFTLSGSIAAQSSGGATEYGGLCLKGGGVYTAVLKLGSPSLVSDTLLLDSLVLLPDLSDIDIYMDANTSAEDKSLIADCRTSVVGVDPEGRNNLSCSDIEFSIMAEVFNGAIPCNCNGEGNLDGTTTNCDSHGGQCVCKPNIVGRSCEYCAAYHYGYESGQGCTACDCDIDGSVTLSCNHTTGNCECKLNVNGTICDICNDEYYGLYTGQGCQPCTCNMDYSLNNMCADDGQCECKPGVGGQNCDQCESGFFNLTTDGCTSCGCNPDGMAASGCNVLTGVCECKPYAVGEKCDSCPENYYGFGPWSGKGCIPCTCSGHATNCSTAQNFYYYQFFTDWSLLDEVAVAPRWTGTTSYDNGTVVEVKDIAVVAQESSMFVLKLTDPVNNTDGLFFVSSFPYNGDKRTAYGQVFSFTISQSQLSNQTTDDVGDVFIFGLYADEPLVASLPANPRTNETTYSYTLSEVEDEWHLGSKTGPSPTFDDFYRILAGIKNIYIRAKYTTNPEESSNLYAVRLDYSTSNTSVSSTPMTPIYNVENCVCPPEYVGTFCESCAVTYTRADPSAGPFSECIPCDCNGHSDLGCNPDTGACLECVHNTAGAQCDVCMPGFYGDATRGTSSDCQPCMCPGPAGQNSFSDTCSVDVTAADGFRCDSCTEGHGGDHCEVCVDGYYGTPENYANDGGKCQPCFCNLSPHQCDSVSGQCDVCWNNTEGLHCEVCEFGYWGNIDDCQTCDCDTVGGYGNCSQDTGICICKPNVVGNRCTGCASESWGFDDGDGCTECDCHIIGTVYGQWQCNETHGQCECNVRATGLKCDQCDDGFYDISAGCVGCDCNVNGSLGISCELVTGQCYCNKPTIAGRTCDQCGRVGEDDNTYVEEVFTGPWPDCNPCPECFYNWADAIQEVGDQLTVQYETTLALLKNYNNMSVETVDSTIMYIKGNLSYAQEVIGDAILESAKLAEIEEGFQKIQYEVANLTDILDLIEAKEINVTTGLSEVSAFTGSVQVQDGVYKTAQQIQIDLASPLVSQENLYRTANTSWFNIQSMYNIVTGSNTRVQELTAEVTNLLYTLEVVADDREAATSLYSNQILLDEYAQNTERLAEIDTMQTAFPVVEVQTDVNLANSQANSANSSANLAVDLGEIRREEANTKSYESQIAKFNSSSAEAASMRAQNATQTYMNEATGAKDKMTGYYSDVLDTYSQLTNAENQNIQMQSISTTVVGKSVRPVSEMVAIAEVINSTDISAQAVADTREEAQNTLDEAIRALNNSLEAEKSAQSALNLVKDTQNTILEAESTRQATEQSMIGTDANSTNINDIANKVQLKGNEQKALGDQTAKSIDGIRTTITNTDECFSSKLSQAEDALSAAQQATANAAQGLTEYTTNAENQVKVNEDIGGTYGTIVSQHQQVKSVSDSARNLMSDITNAKLMEDLNALLSKYTSQRTEMELLQMQLKIMETDLDALLNSLEGSQSTDIQCND